MEVKRIRYHFSGSELSEKEPEVIKFFSNSKIELLKFDSEISYKFDNCSSGIVFFTNPDAKLFDFLAQINRQNLQRIIGVSPNPNLSGCDIWQLLESGFTDVFAYKELSDLPKEISARLEHWEKIDKIIESPLVKENLIGTSPIWIKTLRKVIHIGCFTDAPMLITGESGTGKEMVARLVHTLDPKRNKNSLVVLDCTTVVSELSGSEFFGHERGSFTSAVSARDGAFALADKGTLFLDEVGELPLNLQAELLRIVQERKYKRVGGNTWQNTDFRLICATNRNLIEEEKQGNFRRDFYHRLATWTCRLPALNKRVEDIPLLVSHFLNEIYARKEPPAIDDVVMEYLIRREYPGNIRELFQLVRRIAYHHIGNGVITAGDIPEEDRPSKNSEITEWRDKNFEQSIRKAIMFGVKLKDITRATEETAETVAIMQADGKVSSAAERLGIDKRTLQMHVKEIKEKLSNLSNPSLPH